MSRAPDPTPGDVTAHLHAWAGGNAAALDELVPLVYEELERLAHRQLRRERSDHTLDTSGLVHEAYTRLVRLDRIQWNDRAHFLALAAQAMRRVLINYAESRRAQKRGGGKIPVSLDASPIQVASATATDLDDLLALDEALKRLAGLDDRQARVVECRFFGGMTVEETASVLEISPATVKRDWTLARAWLNRELSR
ncbi:MAG: sigma-70 family RNA polymerase sigma factor [Rubricoccaceae bacterium]